MVHHLNSSFFCCAIARFQADPKQCFNRSLSGKNATCYGKGAYFARDATYSAQCTYSSPDSSGVQRMYLARVAVGSFTVGNSSMNEAPVRDAARNILFDSVVDRMNDPKLFVVFRDVAAYPEYAIAFR